MKNYGDKHVLKFFGVMFSRFVSILQFWFYHRLSIPPSFFCFLSSSFLSFSLLICLSVFKMFEQPALFHIPLANVAEFFLLIIIDCVTRLLFAQAFNIHSIHSIELVTLFYFSYTFCMFYSVYYYKVLSF